MEEREIALKNLILKVRFGSHLYGTNTPESDEDFVGIFVPSPKYLIGLKRVEEVDLGFEDKDEFGKNTKDAVDFKVYTLAKFAKLALENNPNILDVLFTNEENIVFINDVGRQLLNLKYKFLSKRVRDKFIGYANSQKHKMVIKLDNFEKINEAYDYICNNEKNYRFLLELIGDTHHPLFVKKKDHVTIGDLNVPVTVTIKKVKSILDDRASKFSSRKELITKYGFDCYHKDTEFLTKEGWKKFDDIKNDEPIGTFNRYNRILEFQKPYERVKKINDSGELYEYNGLYTSFCVTLNHRMFVSDVHRNKLNNFSTDYTKIKSNWRIDPLHKLLDVNRSHFHIEHTINNFKDPIDIDDDLLVLIGVLISDGTFCKFNKFGIPRCIRISQTIKGKLEMFKFMDSIMDKFNFRRYDYNKETIWISHNKSIVKFIYNSCGHGSRNKRLPKFIYELSMDQCNLLLHGLFLGDGSDINEGTLVYHTVNKNLADGVQILALLASREVNVNGPYESISNFNGKVLNMYQVFYSKSIAKKRYVVLSDKYSSHQKRPNSKFYKVGGKYIDYSDYIVCFSVPNELLVTRYNGKIAIQGNTKFGSHLIRLLKEGQELLTTGDLKFPLGSVELLKDIRSGKYPMNKVIELADDIKRNVDDLYETDNTLPRKPDFDTIEKFVMSVHRKYILED